MSDLPRHELLHPRSYQLEMLEASLRGNIIVTMDTGSGKTQIAILRISKELETCPAGKIVWFLAPTVALCEQQHKAICLQLPNERTKLLVGRDNVDRWTSHYWNVALSGVRIAVSTYAVLADALSHDFVTMAKLALLVFDEAHHCSRKHAANKIMRFYYRQASPLNSVSRPKILGLTASPTNRSMAKDLCIIEANLDSVIKTPCIHRDELMQHVRIPEPLKITYIEDLDDPQTWSSMLKSLVSCIKNIDEGLNNQEGRLLSKDEIAKLRANDIKRRQWTSQGQHQLRRFSNWAQDIQKELGPWCSDYYIRESIKRLTLSMNGQQNRHLGWKDEPKIYILNSLGQLPLTESMFDTQPQMDAMVSNKCAEVLSFLRKQASTTFRGIIFVDRRVTAFVLCHLLSTYPGTKYFIKCGTFVGISTNDSKKMELRDLLDPQDQLNTLTDFREGRKNLLIATTALEEGIDISACNVVICFNRPPNLKSYVQRRGRARQESSTIVLLSCLNDEADVVADWEKMEAEMIAEYMKDRRDSVEGEGTGPGDANMDQWILRADSTGAQITLDEALGHLNHFCQHLRAFPQMSNLPVFVFEKEEATGLLRAHVTLPNSIHPSVRRASGVRTWSTEAMARKDAAFQAYVALYNAKLLNDNLLPLSRDMLLGVDGMKDSSSIVNIQQQYNPWHDIAKKWSTPHKSFWKSVNIQWAEYGAILINLLLPVDIPSFEWPPLSPQDGVEYEWSMRVSEGAIDTEICDVSLLRAATKKTLLCFQDYSSMDNQDDFVALFIPQIVSREIQEWLESRLAPFPSTNDWSAGHPTSFKVSYNEKMRRDCFWKIRYRSEDCADSIVTDRELLLANGTNLIEIAKANKKLQVDCSKDGSRAHDISKARIRQKEPSNITQAYQDAQIFALLAPFVMRRLEIQLVGKELRNRLMPNVYFRNWNLLVEAISTTSSRELLNNKRLAFLGDTVLDFLATSQLFANHSIWPAGYLSAKKKLIISNSHLSKMALDVGLDKFIITDPLNPSNWKPPYISDINANVNDVESTRLVSKSILADAVEALIGAAYLDGQYKNALECTQIFLPEIMGHSVGSSFTPTLLDYGHENSIHFAPNHFAPLEELIGYKFRNSTFLAEAITHPSYEQDLEIGSYGRLAFLGSAVLSMVIVESLFQEKPSLSPNQMHLLRTATINNGFLAFICLETHMEEEYVDIQQSASRNFREVHLGRSVRLWGFLRYGNSELGMARRTFLEKHGNTCQYIRERLASGGVYPWLELAKLEQNSDLPDVIQALFGAVFHDSNGDIKQCALLAERLRILPILRQLIQRKVDVLHPKTRLQELVMDRQVTYLPKFESVRNEHSCVIRMNGNIIAEDRGGSCRDEIIIRASELAIMSLEGKSLQ